MEILAPVGGKEQLIAAVRSGANAVYLGARDFNARRNAENFDAMDMAQTVKYCHSHGVRVHVTLNTLVTDDELESLYRTADEVAQAGVDAVIVQDMAVFEYLKGKYPDLPLHASTQSVVHNVQSARYMKDLGFSRVVLARELSLEEIKKIHDSVDVEIETFIHGALCMCVSGACYLSSAIGGRSGNRGLCAQPCRLNFKSGGREYALSLKDMSHIKYIKDLEKAGVCSVKIEGRMKRPEYVAAATAACVKASRGEQYDESALQAVFSRSGFTDGYMKGKRDLDMFGHREKDDVMAASKVLKSIENTYHKENPLLPVNMVLSISGSEKCTLMAECLGKSALAEGETAIKATGRETDEETARRNLSKLGGTQFYLDGIKVQGERGLMVPPSVLNAMRRDVIGKLNEALSGKNIYNTAEFKPEPLPEHRAEETKLWARFFTAGQMSEPEKYEKIILPTGEILKNPWLIEKYGDKIAAEAPCVAFPEYEGKVLKDMEKLKEMGLRGIFAENVYAIELGKKLCLEVYGGAGLNILNSRALDVYSKDLNAATLSFELNMAKAEKIRGSIKRGIVGYGFLPLMRVRNCPGKTNSGCGGCDRNKYLVDRKGMKFPILCEDRRFSTILNCVPLHIAEKPVRNMDYILLYFTKESRGECSRVLEDFLLKRPFDGQRTGGLYYRTLA